MASNEKVPENQSSPKTENKKVPDWVLARQGINLIINNDSTEANKIFLEHPESIVLFAGYSFATFMDGLMSFEDDKMNLAITTLKDVEKRCAAETGWLKYVIPKVFGTTEPAAPKSLAEQLETQIILADSQVCIGILTFLQQDISGFFKAGWVLRKSWKVYQKVYKEILALYTEHVGELELPDPLDLTLESPAMAPRESEACSDWDIPEFQSTNGYTHSKIPLSKSAILHKNSNGTEFTRLNTSRGSATDVHNHTTHIKKSTSTSSGLTNHSNRESLWSFKFSPFHGSLSLNSFPSPLNLFSSHNTIKDQQIDKEVIQRLMGAISFGYGLFQLGISLLPPSLLRFTNILGFAANRQNGIACLMYSRLGKDMRAPLATLALLWYHTIVRPFYAVDGTNVQAGVDAATALLKESEEEYGKSALFLFFRGRTCRLASDIKAALKSFQDAADNASQREIKLLSLHEVGWCHLIELNYSEAQSVFGYMHTSSRWSRCFYAYLAAICSDEGKFEIDILKESIQSGYFSGTIGEFSTNESTASISGACKNTPSYTRFEELKNCLNVMRKGNQLEEYLNRRVKFCPSDNSSILAKKSIFWKLLIFEMLYLWNALASCSSHNISEIIKECTSITELPKDEPMIGLSKLILGSALCISGKLEKGIENFRICLKMRQKLPLNAEDAHVSAFAHYELGSLLIKKDKTKQEGIALLQQISHFTKFDFEQKLTVRVCSLLRQANNNH